MDFFKTPELKAEHSIEELKTYLYQCVRMNLELDKMKDLNMSENAHLREIVGRVVETYEQQNNLKSIGLMSTDIVATFYHEILGIPIDIINRDTKKASFKGLTDEELRALWHKYEREGEMM